MSSVQIEQKSYEMPPREGSSIAHFVTVADVERSARYYGRRKPALALLAIAETLSSPRSGNFPHNPMNRLEK